MTFASNAEADPDPTTQMTWPSSRRSVSGSQVFKSNYPGGQVESPQVERGPLRLDTTSNFKTLVGPGPGRRLTTKDLICLSISMAGAQIAWTVELGCVLRLCPVSRFLRRPCPLMLRYISGMLTDFAGRYGTPFLLSLGVSEQLTSLVWLAGPISGLIAQPLIGASIFPPIQLSPPSSQTLSPRSWTTSKISSITGSTFRFPAPLLNFHNLHSFLHVSFTLS